MANSSSAASAAVAKAPMPPSGSAGPAPSEISPVTLKDQRAFLNQILYMKKTGDQSSAIQAIHEEYLNSQMEA